jgi:hypothetical protein
MRHARIVLLAAAIAVLALVSACAGSPKPSSSPSASSGWQNYTDKANHFSVSYDAGNFTARVSKEPSNLPGAPAADALILHLKGRPDEGLWIEALRLPSAARATSIMNAALAAAPSERTTVNGVPGVKTRVPTSNGAFVCLLYQGRFEYSIMVLSKARSWSTIPAPLMAVVTSFRVTE